MAMYQTSGGKEEKKNLWAIGSIQDGQHNLQGPVKNENAGPLLKNEEEFQDDNSRALNQAKSPSKHKALCDYTCHTST